VKESGNTVQTAKPVGHPLKIYTDGSSRGNPGPGGYGAVLLWGDAQKELSGGYRLTTNNRMELLAVIKALESLKKRDLSVTIYTDSQYVVNSVEKKWLNNWVKTDFKGGKKNKDLWLHFHTISKHFKLKFVWVKGHAENKWNNRCDDLATTAADSKNLLIDEGYETENTK
jgi:ribonuclease HI